MVRARIDFRLLSVSSWVECRIKRQKPVIYLDIILLVILSMYFMI